MNFRDGTFLGFNATGPYRTTYLLIIGSCIASALYLLLADCNPTIGRFVVFAIALPIVSAICWLLYTESGPRTFVFWMIVIATIMPIVLHGLSHLAYIFGLGKTGQLLHDWRYIGLGLPHLVGFVVYSYILASSWISNLWSIPRPVANQNDLDMCA